MVLRLFRQAALAFVSVVVTPPRLYFINHPGDLEYLGWDPMDGCIWSLFIIDWHYFFVIDNMHQTG